MATNASAGLIGVVRSAFRTLNALAEAMDATQRILMLRCGNAPQLTIDHGWAPQRNDKYSTISCVAIPLYRIFWNQGYVKFVKLTYTNG